MGADPSQLASVAVTRLHEELAKDGRDPAGASSFKVPEKAPAGAGAGRSAFSKSLSKKKGQESPIRVSNKKKVTYFYVLMKPMIIIFLIQVMGSLFQIKVR